MRSVVLAAVVGWAAALGGDRSLSEGLAAAAREHPDHLGLAVVEVAGPASVVKTEGRLQICERPVRAWDWLYLRWAAGRGPAPADRFRVSYALRGDKGEVQPAEGAKLLVLLVPGESEGVFAAPVMTPSDAAAAAAARAALAEALPASKPAWPGVFPDLAGFEKRLVRSEFGPDGGASFHRQSARYEWLGGAPKVVTATAGFEAGAAKRYSAAVVLREEVPPKLVRVRKRLAWRWDAASGPRGIDEPCQRLVVPTGRGGYLELEATGSACEDLRALAERFPLDRIASAVTSPPKD